MTDAEREMLYLCAKYLRATLPDRSGVRNCWEMESGELSRVNDVLDAYFAERQRQRGGKA